MRLNQVTFLAPPLSSYVFWRLPCQVTFFGASLLQVTFLVPPLPSYVFWCLPCPKLRFLAPCSKLRFLVPCSKLRFLVPPLPSYAFKICNWKMENEKQYVYMNHFTLGEKRQPVKKNQHPPSSRIFPFNSFLLCHSIFHFPIEGLLIWIVLDGVAQRASMYDLRTSR